ncbi:uncharacterized protein LOC107619217 isoform X1 [Arachis ipaensis]|uniref:uncharacterized protein LOC107619217 isoform X1 n=1 Tax=Arachis ipaensis TaxID=130454 RepID=UPI000A2B44C4|nr:uncharacterized protein LOC107619217 isoform X1 [Arachis ipaensis]
MTVQDIPKSMNLVFRPTDDMNLSGVELVVATYIFMRHLPESEILIDIGDCYATRGALMTLAPKMEVVDDVLNTVVCMLTLASNTNAWFLPMTIMQAAVGGRSLTSANIRSIRNNYMRSKVDQVTRVYQPMWCDQHWYLMIIDVREQKLIYVDSLRDPREADARKTAMMRVALYLEGMTLGNSWLSGDGAMRPRFFAFKYEEPDVPQQVADSMDCGIWVAQWMIRAHMWQDYGVQHVNAATRMRLAVDLVMKSHNQLAQDSVSEAFAHWQTETA